MIARGLSNRGFPVGLRVSHALVNALENLSFRQPGIFQAPNLRASHRRPPRQPPVQNGIHCPVGKPDQPEHHGISANDIELIKFRDFQDHGLRVARAREADCRIRARKQVSEVLSFFSSSTLLDHIPA